MAADNPASRLYSGSNLIEPLRINVSLTSDSYVVVRAEQRRADYQIALFKKGQSTAIKTVNLSAHKAVDELLLVEASDCQHCRIELSADASLDQRGPYSLRVESHQLPGASTASSAKTAAALATLRVISRVGELSYQLHHPTEGDPTDPLAIAASALSSLLSEGRHNKHTPHAQFLALQIAGMRRESSQVVTLAEQIAATGRQGPSLYSIQAVFELARQADTMDKKHALFRQGIADAATISEPVLYAKGANYLAISLTQQGRFEQSLGLFKEVYDIYSREQNLGALMYALHNLSWANQRAGHLPQAIAYAAQQKLLAQEYQAHSNVIWALYNMAIGYAELGDHYEADQFLDQALDRYGALSEPEQRDNDGIYGAILEERAESLLRLGDVASARDLAIIIKAHYEAANFNRNLANFGMLEGKIAIADERFDDARSGLQASLDYFQQSQEGRSAGLAHFRIAQLELTQSNFLLASQHNAAALKNLSGTEDYLSLAKALSQSIAVLVALGADTAADEMAQQMETFINRFGREDVAAEFAFQRAKVAQSLGRDADALNWLDDALKIVEVKLPKVKRRDLRQQYLALQKSLFELNIGLLVDQGKVQAALGVLESFKARTLKETVSGVRNSGALPPKLRRLRRDLHQQILQSAKSWYGNSGNQERTLLAETRSLSRELEKLEVAIALRQDDAKLVSERPITQAVPRITGANEVMLLYFIGQQRSWVWRVDKSGVALFELPPEPIVAPLVSAVKQQISVHPRLRRGGSAYEFRQTILELGELLLGSVFTNTDLSIFKNLTVIPDGPLNGLSFAPLQLSDMEHPLLSYTAIAYAPSYQALMAIEERAKRPSQNRAKARVLVVADPIDLTRSDTAFERLPQTVFEAQSIRSILADRVQVLMGQEATKKNLLTALSNEYSILHFATHGLLNSQTPALSGLVFTRDSESANFWLTPEISSADLRADLVVLSACESSIGKQVAGEGLLSLSRAFIEAGANHVIGTLWKVQDAATAELTSRFYSKLLDDSLAISVALQAAQLAVYTNQHNDWRDPYYWAGFQLQGSWQTVTYGSDESTE